MATIYGKGHGKSGSKKPAGKTIYSWLSYKPKEVELLIVKLAKEGKNSSQVGLILRDSYGIPDVRTLIKKRITQVLAEKKLLSELPEDILAIIRKDVALHKHMEANKQDMTAKRGLQLTESKLRRLATYYRRVGKLPADWQLETERLKMYLE